MAPWIEYLGEDGPSLGALTSETVGQVLLSGSGGKQLRIPSDRVLFRHEGSASAAELEQHLDELAREIDVNLLWEALTAEQRSAPIEPEELAALYFDDATAICASAVFRALCADRRHFRRRGRSFEARSPQEIEALDIRARAEVRSKDELTELEDGLRARPLAPALCERIERHLRGAPDKPLARTLLVISPSPAAHAFELLLEAGYLPWDASLEALQANLQANHPVASLAHAESLEPQGGQAPTRTAAFTIDDPETREVDDAISVDDDGGLTRITIDIADVSTWVRPGDPIDREAARRAATAYRPTGSLTMLPQRIGCELASLRAGEPRAALRTTIWVDETGEIARRELALATVRVGTRLDYDEADRLIEHGEGGTAEALRQLKVAADRLLARRRARGALIFRRREWKIRVSSEGKLIQVRRVPPDSASRMLVAEMMIALNSACAEEAFRRSLPCIYRVQQPPLEPIAETDLDRPRVQARLRRLLQPVALSTQRGPHSALGVELYAQASSPLRRYADLVMQRQIRAALEGDAAPYGTAELLAIIAAVESTEREVKRVEAAESTRWALELVARLEEGTALVAQVIGPAPGGHRVQLELCGAIGILADGRRHEAGETVEVEVRSVEPRRGTLRLQPVSVARSAQ